MDRETHKQLQYICSGKQQTQSQCVSALIIGAEKATQKVELEKHKTEQARIKLKLKEKELELARESNNRALKGTPTPVRRADDGVFRVEVTTP